MNDWFDWKFKIIPVLLLFICFSLPFSYALFVGLGNEENTIQVGYVSPDIVEDFDSSEGIKKDVVVKNSGNADIYVRALIVFSFYDEDGNIFVETPLEGTDYSISLNLDKWLLGSDGYYYFKEKLSPGDNTDVLIEECKELKKYGDKIFSVEIDVQGIQAVPSKAVEEAWGVSITDEVMKIV